MLGRRTHLQDSATVAVPFAVVPWRLLEGQAAAEAAFRVRWMAARQQMINFAKRIGATLLEVSLDTALDKLSASQGHAADGAADQARDAGYTGSETPVYRADETIFFALTEPDTQDAQISFILPAQDALCPACFLGGPAIAAMNQAARDLAVMNPHLTPQQIGTFFLPTATIEGSLSWLTYTHAWTVKFWTTAGWTAMRYRPLHQSTHRWYGDSQMRLDVYQPSRRRRGGWERVLAASYRLDTP